MVGDDALGIAGMVHRRDCRAALERNGVLPAFVSARRDCLYVLDRGKRDRRYGLSRRRGGVQSAVLRRSFVLWTAERRDEQPRNECSLSQGVEQVDGPESA